jgi:hypothetical protein
MPHTFPIGRLGGTGFSLCAVLWHGGRSLGTGLCLPSVGQLTGWSARRGVGLAASEGYRGRIRLVVHVFPHAHHLRARFARSRDGEPT